jgi:hypothetical protein
MEVSGQLHTSPATPEERARDTDWIQADGPQSRYGRFGRGGNWTSDLLIFQPLT